MATSTHQCDQDASEPLEGNYFVSVYPPFACWKKETLPAVRRMLWQEPAATGPTPLGLYIHIPFCVHRCQYCYYRSYAGQTREERDRYVDAVLEELALYHALPALLDHRIDFVYFGGGTPSLLSAEQIDRLLHGVQAIFPWTAAREVTFECAPKTVTPRRLATLKGAGVTRISLGVQQLDDDVLRKNGRVHLTRDVERACAEIARVGFETVNVDLMVGLVGETDQTFDASLQRVIQMQPDSVTIYQLEIPPNTPLFRALREGSLETAPAGWDVKRRRLTEAFARLECAGYTVRSAYAAVRDPTTNRFLYQDAQYHGADLLGAGVASFSYVSGVYYQNLASLEDYLASLADDRLPLARACALRDEERMVREFVLQLKLGRVESRHFRDKFRVEIGDRFADPIKKLSSRGWITCDSDGVTLTRQGLVRVDRLIPEFYLPAQRHTSYW